MQSLLETKTDTTLLEPFSSAVVNVMQMMAGFEATVGQPQVKSGSNRYSVYGIIGFSGGIIGTVSVSLTRIAAEKLVDRLTGTLIDSNSSEFADAIGEVANMIAGSAKASLGTDSSITVPTVVISDRGCQYRPLTGVACMVIPCSGAIGEFAVEVCIKRTDA